MQHNPLLTASAHQVAGARANLSGQRVPVNPTLNYAGLNNTVASLNPGNPANYNIYYTLETSGRQRLRTHLARAQLQSTEADAETTRQTVRQATANAYIALQVANAALDNEKAAYETAKRLSDLTEKQFKLGAAPETNAIRSSLALTQEEQNLYTAVSSVLVARANLNIQMGRDADRPVDAAEPLTYTPITVKLDDLKQQALRSRPEIRSAEANRHTLQATVGMQRSQYYPDLILGTSGNFDQLQAGLTIPLFDFGSIRGSVNKAKEDVKVQEAQELQVREGVLLDVQTAHANLIAAQNTVQALQSGALPRAESLLSRIEQGYKLGAGTILDLIDAQETLRTTRNAYYGAIGNYAQAVVQLERAVATPLSTTRR